MADKEIIVEELTADDDGWIFKVSVLEIEDKSEHVVSLNKKFFDKTGRVVSAEDLVRSSFEFLLKREPKESILKSFDISEIKDYFPEFEKETSE